MPHARLRPGAPRSALADLGRVHQQQLTGLAEHLFLASSAPLNRAVAVAPVTESRSGWVAAALGEAVALRCGRRVCVVDARTAGAPLPACFGLASGHGLAEAVREGRPLNEAATQLDDRLWLLGAGNPSVRRGLGHDQVQAALVELARHVDVVLVQLDGLAEPDGPFALAASTGEVLLVLDGPGTRRDVARAAADRLRSLGAAIVGAVLVDAPDMPHVASDPS